jgi:hypothetical protein
MANIQTGRAELCRLGLWSAFIEVMGTDAHHYTAEQTIDLTYPDANRIGLVQALAKQELLPEALHEPDCDHCDSCESSKSIPVNLATAEHLRACAEGTIRNESTLALTIRTTAGFEYYEQVPYDAEAPSKIKRQITIDERTVPAI